MRERERGGRGEREREINEVVDRGGGSGERERPMRLSIVVFCTHIRSTMTSVL